MKHITFIFLFLFAFSASAGMINKQDIRNTEKMSQICIKQIAKYQWFVDKYSAIPPNRRTRLDKLKLGHVRAELENWKGYCSDDDNSVSR